MKHLIAVLCLVVFSYSLNSVFSQKDGLLKIYFISLGQGSVFIETPKGTHILIDGGNDNTILQKLGELMPFYDKTIDLVVVTDHIHLGGLISVLNRYRAGDILEAKNSDDSPQSKSWQDLITKNKIRTTEALAGKTIDVGDLSLKVVYSSGSFDAGTDKKGNANIGLMLFYKSLRLMISGNMSPLSERSMIMNGTDIKSDVIYFSGSKMPEEFISAVNPRTAIISGESGDVLKLLDDYGIKYYQNVSGGEIKLISDGINYKILKQ